MPRQPRIDAPGLLFHIIVRGIARGLIFIDDQDREFFLRRLGRILIETGTTIHTFALMPNHLHLLVRREETPLPTVMRRLLTSYAIYFNKRHERVGHLFQNRYKSIICQEESYYRELIRYIHLNPMRAEKIKSLEELDQYEYCGHSYIIGTRRVGWLSPKETLGNFGYSTASACLAYRQFMRSGVRMQESDECGKAKQRAGFKAFEEMQDLTVPIFEDESLKQQLSGGKQRNKPQVSGSELERLMAEECEFQGVSVKELLSGAKSKPVSAVRKALVVRMTNELGFTRTAVAGQLCLGKSSVSMIMRRLEDEGL